MITVETATRIARAAKAALQGMSVVSARAYISTRPSVMITVEWHKMSDLRQEEVRDFIHDFAHVHKLHWGRDFEVCGWSRQLINMQEV